jgi:hypothetical protein
MVRQLAATARFIRAFARPTPDPLREREVLLPGGRQATVYLPRSPGPAPGWILLHGVTVRGRHHDAARRLARSLAAAGCVALVPEVPAWTELRVDVRETDAVIRDSLAWMEAERRVDARRAGLMGFSVAATWGLEAAAGPYRGRFRSVVAVGGYASWRAVLRAMIAGERETPSGIEAFGPDPYGRWIMGANLLPLLEGDRWGPAAARAQAAGALRRLAWTAGRNGAIADSPIYDRLNAELRSQLPPAALRCWDTIAPFSSQPTGPLEAARSLADDLATAALNAEPALDPAGQLDDLCGNVVLLHGRADRLIPSHETVCLAALLPARVRAHVTISALMGHTRTREAKPPRDPRQVAKEVASIVRCFETIVGSLND